MMDPAAEIFPHFLQLMRLARREEELESWESELEKTRIGLENWKSELENRENELKMMGVYTYLMSKMRLAGSV